MRHSVLRTICFLVVGAGSYACAPTTAPLRRSGWQPSQDIVVLLSGGSDLPGIIDMTAAAQIRITHPEGSHTASASFQFLPTSLLRVDVRGPLFQHVLTVVIDADTLWSLSRGQLSMYDARHGLADLLDINLRGQDPVAVLLGLVGGFDALDVDSVAYPRADRATIVIADRAGSGKDGGRRRLWVDVSSGFVVKDEGLGADGRRHWQRWLTDYARVGDTDTFLPRTVKIESDGRSLQVHYGSWKLNRGLRKSQMFRGLGLGERDQAQLD